MADIKTKKDSTRIGKVIRVKTRINSNGIVEPDFECPFDFHVEYEGKTPRESKTCLVILEIPNVQNKISTAEKYVSDNKIEAVKTVDIMIEDR